MRLGVVGAGIFVLGAQVAADMPSRPRAGSWTQEIKITRMEGDAPAKDIEQARAMMQGMYDMVAAMPICVTPQMAAEGDPSQITTEWVLKEKNCEWSKRSLEGSKLDYAGRCSGRDGGFVDVSMNGDSTPTFQDLTVDMRPKAEKAGGSSRFTLRVVSRWAGDCKS